MKHEKHGFPCVDDSCWCKNFQRKNAMTGWDQKRDNWPDTETTVSDGETNWITVDDGWPKEPDMVSQPEHYMLDGGVEALDIISDVLTKEEYIGYLRGNILKYHLRANKKNGRQDLEKADFYSNELVSELAE